MPTWLQSSFETIQFGIYPLGKGGVILSQLGKTWYEYLINHQERKNWVKLNKLQQVMDYLDSASYTLKTIKDPRLIHSASTILAWLEKSVCIKPGACQERQKKGEGQKLNCKRDFFWWYRIIENLQGRPQRSKQRNVHITDNTTVQSHPNKAVTENSSETSNLKEVHNECVSTKLVLMKPKITFKQHQKCTLAPLQLPDKFTLPHARVLATSKSLPPHSLLCWNSDVHHCSCTGET